MVEMEQKIFNFVIGRVVEQDFFLHIQIVFN